MCNILGTMFSMNSFGCSSVVYSQLHAPCPPVVPAGPSLLAISVIAGRLCQWLSSIADYASFPEGSEVAKATTGAAAHSPLGNALSLTPSRVPQASTPLSPYGGTEAGLDSSGRSRGGGGGGANGASPVNGEVAALVAAALQQGCRIAGVLLMASLQRLQKQQGGGADGGGGPPLVEALRGPSCMHAVVVENARAVVTMAGGGGRPAAVPLALGAEVMCGLLGGRSVADGSGDGDGDALFCKSGGWGDAMTLAIEGVLPQLAMAFPDEVEAALSSGDRGGGAERAALGSGGRGKAGGSGRVGGRAGRGGRRGAGGQVGGGEQGGPGQVALELLDAWGACLDAVLALRNHGGFDVQGCVDALQGPLVAGVRWVGGWVGGWGASFLAAVSRCRDA